MNMRKRVQIALAVLLVAVSGFIVWQVLRLREPVFAGKGLRAWLEEYSTSEYEGDREDARRAISAIGTNAIPILLAMLRERDFPHQLLKLAQRQNLVEIRHIPARNWKGMAAAGFFVLGNRADSATPALFEIYERNVSLESRHYAMMVLGNIGPPAKRIVPSLLPQTTDTNEITRYYAVWALGQIHCEPDLVVPVLIKCLRDPVVQVEAMHGLGNFGKHAKQAIPALVQLLQNTNKNTCHQASAALYRIDPEAAARAGVVSP